MRRRAFLLAGPALLAGCGSVLPGRDAPEVRRFQLNPNRPGPPVAARGRQQVLLLRGVRAAPGLERRGLRRLRPDGSLDIAFYEEWVTAPAELAEAALRAWLGASGRFSAVVAPGSRAETGLVLEAQLTALEVVLAQGIARAAIAGVLLRETGLSAQVLSSFDLHGTAPLPQPLSTPGEAAAMEAALGIVFAQLEETIARFA